MKKIVVAFLFCTLFQQQANSQTSNFAHNELGLFLGTAFYMGDLNPYSPFSRYVKPAIGLVYRRVLNPRFALKTNFYYGKVAGNDATSKLLLQRLRGLSFVTPIYELSQQIEFNFFPYEIGNPRLFYTTPYAFVGLSAFYFSPRSSGNKIAAGVSEGKRYSPIALSLPLGMGLKADISRRIGLSFEFGMRRAWTDYIDDVSKTFIDAAASAANPMAIGIGRQRGNSRSKDWYTFTGVILSFRMNDRLALCPAYN